MSEEETQPTVTLQEVLSTPVRDEYIAARGKLSYVTGRYVKQMLNQLFGPLGWSYKVLDNYPITDDPKSARWFAHVRLTVTVDGTTVTRDGLAVGHGLLQKEIWEDRRPTGKFEDVSAGRANEVIDFAAAEAVTDALKRAAVSLGQVFGLSLYPMVPGQDDKPAARPAPKSGGKKATGFKKTKKF